MDKAPVRKWTPEEDEILKQAITELGKHWNVIASRLKGRTASQVASRWEKCLDPTITKGPFTPEEDSLIIQFVEQNGPRYWPHITSILPNRSPKQCRERWFNHLQPDVKKTPWTEEEDQLIFEQHQQLGAKWSVIAKMLPGRSDNAIKNRWNSSISKRIQPDQYGGVLLTPDSSHRQYKSHNRQPKERFQPPPLQVPPAIVEPPEQHHSPPPPPSLQIPSIDTPSMISPGQMMTPFGFDSHLFSPASPLPNFTPTPFGSMNSPGTSQNPFFFSPVKPTTDEFQ